MHTGEQQPTLGERILVVDDSDLDRTLLCRLLEKRGYQVVSAGDAETALKRLTSATPDLILLDVSMPGMDGYQLCHQIRTSPATATTPVIFVSANAGSEDRIAAFASGGVDYLIKPIEAGEVYARIQTHLSLQNLRRHLDQQVRERTQALEASNRQLVAEIAERHAVEASLHQRNALISCLFDANIIGIMFLEGDGTLTDANSAFRQLFGLETEDIVQRRVNWEQLVVPEQRKDTVAALARLSHDKRVSPVEKSCLDRHGNRFSVLVGAAQPLNQQQIVAFVLDLSERKRIEQALRQSRAHLRELAARGDAAMEQERKRIAREIHDEQGSLLTALKLDLSLLRREVPDRAPALEKRLASMQQLLDETVRVMRQIASQLRPAALNLGLQPSLEWLASDFSKRTGILCQLDTGPEITLDDAHASALFRIVQEALTNVTRHAAATQVSICLENSPHELRVLIKDNGSGFNPNTVGKASLGLSGIRERLEILGGDLEIASHPGQGTTLRILMPHEKKEP